MLLESLDEQTLETVRHALAEDIGDGDVSAALIPADTVASAHVVSREAAVVCGRPWFDGVFRLLDETIAIHWLIDEGEAVRTDQRLCELRGPARSLLTGERTALNFLQTLSGTATLARRYADAVAGFDTRVLDTRKTLPGLRREQKYAVRCGGCHNHRMGLYDAFLIKENHIAAAGSIAAAVAAAGGVRRGILLEVEIETFEQLDEALAAGVTRILLDNFAPDDLRKAVALAGGRAELEASGGIDLDNIAEYAATGVDYISIGALTKDVRAVDLSMRFDVDR
jgi:nicotinate-nucleotide pyrophosphorylase (carboxylating)